MELTRFQKIMLAVTAGMLVFFGLLMAVFRAHPGVAFEESLLKITEQEGRTVYSGKAHGTPVTITVTWPTNFKTVVDFTIGDAIHDVCEVEYPLDRMETEHGDTVNTIRITKNGGVLFEGGYDPEREYGWYDANGEWAPFTGSGFRVYSGNDPWSGYETTAGEIVRFAFGPETSVHGHPAFFAMAVFVSLILAVDILFWKELFRLRHWAARDPEPSEEYLTIASFGWGLLAFIIAGIYIAGLAQIY